MPGARKAVFFTFDGILAAALLLIALRLMTGFFISSTTLVPVTFLSQDAAGALAELKVSEVNTTSIQLMISNGTIADPNVSVLEQIGDFWAQNQTYRAQNLTREVLGSILSKYAVHADGDLIDNLTAQTGIVVSGKRIVSGITKGRAKGGFNARSIAKQVRKNTTEIFRFQPQGSAQEGGTGGEFIKRFFLNTTNLIKGKMYVSIKYGVSNIQSNKVLINGVDLGLTQSDWYVEDSNITPNNQLAFVIADITDKLQSGWNSAEIQLKSSTSGHARIQPGTRIEATFSAEDVHDVNETLTEQLFFDQIDSHETGNKKSGAWAVMPIHVRPNTTVQNAVFRLAAQDIESDAAVLVVAQAQGNCTTINTSAAWNLRVYLNNETIHVNQTPTPLAPLVKTVDLNFDLTSYLRSGTNVLAVYLNSYIDCFWGDDDTIIYSNPQTNSSGSSYVNFTYTRTADADEYGKVDVNLLTLFNQTSTQMSNNFTHNQSVFRPLFESFVELVTLENQNLSAYVNGNQVYQTLRPFATPTTLYIDNSYVLVPGNNTVNVRDCQYCKVRPESAYVHRVLVPNQVGYGATFDNQSDAIADAAARLEALVGDAITLLQLQNETIGISKVPSLWGPALMEVRVWP